MRLPQVSIVIENKAGAMIRPCQLLADVGINIVTLSLADTDKTGMLRLIVADWQRAKDSLQAAGYEVAVHDVVAIEVSDRPGGLLELLKLFGAAGINVSHMYAFTERLGDCAVMVFCFDDLDAAIACLTRAGINPVMPVYLYDREKE
jgi:hypothetical protein